MRIVPKSRGHVVREVVIPTCFFRGNGQHSKRPGIVTEQRLPAAELGPGHAEHIA
jgi:hypothetical protein